jgi:hypothetical protein
MMMVATNRLNAERRMERQMRNVVLGELREVVWLASAIGGLSVLGVGLAVALALGLGG